ncbi:hypothetical protein MMC25_006868 [Agyrium rufum]|nr:hypothetical protein [Agyrium rufum]
MNIGWSNIYDKIFTVGAGDTKLAFKQAIFRLAEPKRIPYEEESFWRSFTTLPESAEDVFSLFSAPDIRRIRDASLPNLETLIRFLSARILSLRHNPVFPDPQRAPERELLNCVRILTRVLPYIYEKDELEAWEDRTFWERRGVRKDGASSTARGSRTTSTEVLFDTSNASSGADTPATQEEADGNFEEREKPSDEADNEDVWEDSKPLAEDLIDALIDLLFYAGLTLPLTERLKTKVTYAIWQTGVGCNTQLQGVTREMESNRLEVLRLLLAFASKGMYMSAAALPVKGVKAISFITTCPDKQVVLSMLCSMLNTTLNFNPATWRVPYDHMVFKDPKQALASTSLQFLLVLLLYPIPEEGRGPSPKNFFRHFLGRLHRPQDFQFIFEGMKRILQQPLQATSSYLPGSQKSLKWANEMIMLFWEAIQCNKRFRAYAIDTERGNEFMILILYYAIEYRLDLSRQGVVRMCVFVLQTLSTEEGFGPGLNRRFEGEEKLPPSIKVENFRGTYGDFLICSIHTLITGSKGKLDAIYPALLAIINNITAHLEHISPLASMKLVQLFASMSTPSFLLANETNHTLLTSILESLNAIIEHRYEENPIFVKTVFKARKRFDALRRFTLEGGQEEIARLEQLRKHGHDADHVGSPLRTSRASSIDSMRSPPSARTPSLNNVPEEGGPFTIGDDEEDTDEDDEHQHHQSTPSHSSPSGNTSRTPSVSSSVDDAVPLQLRGMSEKARGKMPAGQSSFSRVNSISSLNSPTTPVVMSHSSHPHGFSPSPQWIDTWLSLLPLHTILTLLSVSPSNTPPPTLPTQIERSPVRVHLFEWSPLSLGWYESLLWSFIFAAEMVVQKGTVGVWNGTHIRLFKVEKEAARGPSLMKPMGGVDAVGSNLVSRIGSLNLKVNTGGANAGGGEARGQPPSRTIRDV